MSTSFARGRDAGAASATGADTLRIAATVRTTFADCAVAVASGVSTCAAARRDNWPAVPTGDAVPSVVTVDAIAGAIFDARCRGWTATLFTSTSTGGTMRVATAGSGDRGALSADFDFVAIALSAAIAGVGVLTTWGEEVRAAATVDADAGRRLAPPDLVDDVADLAAEDESEV